jgi:probable F420-dependent oxidoreductase
MKLGVHYPTQEAPGDPEKIRRFVRAAEDLGYQAISHPDHVLGASHENRATPLNGPYTEHDAFDDPFVFFAFCAGLTDKLEFTTGVLVLPQRQTALVAQQAACLDLLSKERLRLGVGIGWNYVEYDALGQDFRTRTARLEEQVGLLRQLWTTPLVSFEGRFDRIDRAGVNPRPRRNIPIWYGGFSEPGYERGARIADGFFFAGARDAAMHGLERVRHHLARLGRDESAYGLELVTMFTRDSQETADTIMAWRDAGGTHGSVSTARRGFGSDIDAHIDFMAEVKALLTLD